LIAFPDLNFRFHFVGSIDEDAKLKDARISYAGEIRDENKVRQQIDECDCLVCPSYAEGMPTVILEAMARGLAIIATDVGAVSRQIKGNGILLAAPDVGNLKDALLEILKLPETELNKLKTRSIELVKEEFLWQKVVEAKINDFKKIID